jgi:hypothetical protein
LYIAVLICEIVTIFLSILLLALPLSKRSTVYLIYICLTVIRVAIFAYNSWYLVGFTMPLVRLYLLLDNNLVVEIASVVTYIMLNYGSKVEFAIAAISLYPVLLFFLVGNFRICMVYCKWSSLQVFIYKLVKAIGTIYFLVYGGYIIINNLTADSGLLLLFVFTTSSFWAELCFTVASMDGSENFDPEYKLEDKHSLLLED